MKKQKRTPESVILDCLKNKYNNSCLFFSMMRTDKEEQKNGFKELKNAILGVIKGVKEFNDRWALKDYPRVNKFDLYESIMYQFGGDMWNASSFFLNGSEYTGFFEAQYNAKEKTFYGKRDFYCDGESVDFSVIEDLPKQIDEVIQILEEIDAEEFKEKYTKEEKNIIEAKHKEKESD